MPMTAYYNRLIDMDMFLKHVLHAAATKVIPMDIFQHSILQSLFRRFVSYLSVRIQSVFVAETEFRVKKSHDEPVNPRHFTAVITVTYQVACKISSLRQKRMDFGGPCCRPAAPDVIGATIWHLVGGALGE